MREGVAGLLHDNTRKPGLPRCRRRWSRSRGVMPGVDDDGQDHLLQVRAMVVRVAVSPQGVSQPS